MGSTITLSKMEQVELTQRAGSQSGRADEARRARLILLLDAGHTWAVIREKLDCTDSFIARWSKRFVAERLGLVQSSRRSTALDADTRAGGADSRVERQAQTQ